MPAEWSRLLSRLSRADLQKLLAAKTESEELQQRRAALLKELAAIEKSLAKLAGGKDKISRSRAQTTVKATRRKKAAVKRKAAKSKAKAKPKAKQTGRKAAAATRGGGRQTLEDVVVAILKEHGEPMPFKALLATIVKGKRFATRSQNFDNVLRRTLSTSKRVKRTSRGVYGI